jgi:hypothetical protein
MTVNPLKSVAVKPMNAIFRLRFKMPSLDLEPTSDSLHDFEGGV